MFYFVKYYKRVNRLVPDIFDQLLWEDGKVFPQEKCNLGSALASTERALNTSPGRHPVKQPRLLPMSHSVSSSSSRPYGQYFSTAHSIDYTHLLTHSPATQPSVYILQLQNLKLPDCSLDYLLSCSLE